MPEWWPLKFFIFSNWPGVTRDTFPRLHFPLRSCCREHRLTSLWGSPPLVWSRRRSIPSSCPSRRCLRPTARGRAGRRRRGGGSGSWPFPGSMVGKGGEMGMWKIIITIFTYLQSKCFYLCSFSMPALLCDHKPKWTDWIGRLMKGNELCDGEATLGGSLPPLNGPTQVPLTFLPAAAPVFVDLLQLDGLPLSALSLSMSFIRGKRKGEKLIHAEFIVYPLYPEPSSQGCTGKWAFMIDKSSRRCCYGGGVQLRTKEWMEKGKKIINLVGISDLSAQVFTWAEWGEQFLK